MQHPPKKQPMSRKSRRRMVLILAVLVPLLAASALLPVIRRSFTVRQLDYDVVQSTVRTLDTRAAEAIDTITIYPDGVSSYTLVMQDGLLMLDQNGSRTAIAESFQADILETVTRIGVQNTIADDAEELADELAAMGFDQPQCRAVVRFHDGSEETMEVGAKAYDSEEYYFRWSGAEGIYLCHSGVLETLSTAPNLLLPFEQTAIYSHLIEKLCISNGSGSWEMTFDSTSSGSLTAPYAYPLADDAAQNLMTTLASFRLGAYEAPLTDENATDYGFEDPICVMEIVQRAGSANVIDENGSLATMDIPAQTLRYVIGREEGEFFYTCAHQDQVYLISRFLAETLVQANGNRLISRTPAAMGEELLAHIVFETPQNTVEIAVERTESVLANNELELDASGNIVYQTRTLINGSEAPQEKLEELLDRLNSFAVEGEIPPQASVEDEPRWRITLVTENGTIRVLEGFRLDVFSDAVAVNGVMRHYVTNEAIEMLMAGLV